LHIDVKKFGRFCAPGHKVTGDRTQRSRRVGWDYAHALLDDCSRLAYTELLADERADTVTVPPKTSFGACRSLAVGLAAGVPAGAAMAPVVRTAASTPAAAIPANNLPNIVTDLLFDPIAMELMLRLAAEGIRRQT